MGSTMIKIRGNGDSGSGRGIIMQYDVFSRTTLLSLSEVVFNVSYELKKSVDGI